ncbi:MAG: hypothetical protein M3362_22195, partial [Acidobacteriota bacterium]|nr:hypothetical protein [Acidobacteriota bacterium]
MTTSLSNPSADQLTSETAAKEISRAAKGQPAHRTELTRTLASRFIIFTLCIAVVLSTLAYGTVHYWALALFQLGAVSIVILWVVDAWRTGALRLSRNPLQLSLIGLILLGLFQLLPLRSPAGAAEALSVAPVSSLSLNPYSTRLVLVQIGALLI